MGLAEQLLLMRMWYLLPAAADGLLLACTPFVALQFAVMAELSWLNEARTRAASFIVLGFNLGMLIFMPETGFLPYDLVLFAANASVVCLMSRELFSAGHPAEQSPGR